MEAFCRRYDLAWEMSPRPALFTATRLQTATYLLAVCLFSIAFLVFVNASISFVVTDLIGRHHGVGDAVGTLGFADELLALVACPAWGMLSDRIGVRWVSSILLYFNLSQPNCSSMSWLGLYNGLCDRGLVPVCFRPGEKCLPAVAPG